MVVNIRFGISEIHLPTLFVMEDIFHLLMNIHGEIKVLIMLYMEILAQDSAYYTMKIESDIDGG